jgi:hypothetical protein
MDGIDQLVHSRHFSIQIEPSQTVVSVTLAMKTCNQFTTVYVGLALVISLRVAVIDVVSPADCAREPLGHEVADR